LSAHQALRAAGVFVMKRLTIAAAALALTATASPAAPAKKWFLTLNVHMHTNAGYDAYEEGITIHWEGAFETRDECRARLRLVQLKCTSMISDIVSAYAYGVTRTDGLCRQLRRQPEPVFTPLPNIFKRPPWQDSEDKQEILDCQKL
jgi:hypothetical protein